MNKYRAGRLFIVANRQADAETINSWVEIKLTDKFLDRLLELHTVLIQHSLSSVTDQVEASWNLDYEWIVEQHVANSDSWLEVDKFGFSVKCLARARAKIGAQARHLVFDATYIWGEIAEVVKGMRPTIDFPPSYFKKVGGWESEGEEEAFRNVVMNGS